MARGNDPDDTRSVKAILSEKEIEPEALSRFNSAGANDVTARPK
jgi:hypothetical protein